MLQTTTHNRDQHNESIITQLELWYTAKQ